MIVKDLIEQLKTLPGDSKVIVEVEKIQTSSDDRDISVSAHLEDIVSSFKTNCVILKGTLTK